MWNNLFQKRIGGVCIWNAGQRKYLGNLTVHLVTTPSFIDKLIPCSGGLVLAFVYLQNCIVLWFLFKICWKVQDIEEVLSKFILIGGIHLWPAKSRHGFQISWTTRRTTCCFSNRLELAPFLFWLFVCFLSNFIHVVNMFAISFLDSSLSLNFSLNYGSTVDSVLTTIDTFNVNQS